MRRVRLLRLRAAHDRAVVDVDRHRHRRCRADRDPATPVRGCRSFSTRCTRRADRCATHCSKPRSFERESSPGSTTPTRPDSVSRSRRARPTIGCSATSTVSDCATDSRTSPAASVRLAGKPAPDTYLAACAALEVDPSRALALEDSPNGIAAAKAAGLHCITVPNPLTAALDLSSADLRLDSLAACSLADSGRPTRLVL